MKSHSPLGKMFCIIYTKSLWETLCHKSRFISHNFIFSFHLFFFFTNTHLYPTSFTHLGVQTTNAKTLHFASESSLVCKMSFHFVQSLLWQLFVQDPNFYANCFALHYIQICYQQQFIFDSIFFHEEMLFIEILSFLALLIFLGTWTYSII